MKDPTFRLSEITGAMGEALAALRERGRLASNPDREVQVLIQDVIDRLKVLDVSRKIDKDV